MIVPKGEASPFSRPVRSDNGGASRHVRDQVVGHGLLFISGGRPDRRSTEWAAIRAVKHERISDRAPVGVSALSPRERDVLELVAAGHSNREIAEVLKISEAAIAKHMCNIFVKLDLPADQGHRRVLATLAWLRD